MLSMLVCLFIAIPLSMEQRSALGLSKNQATVAHTYMVIDGLPPSEFYGGGFGVTAKLANWAASREMVTRLYHGGLVTPSLYNEIGEPLEFETSFWAFVLTN